MAMHGICLQMAALFAFLSTVKSRLCSERKIFVRRAESESLLCGYFVCAEKQDICFKAFSVFVVGSLSLKDCLLTAFEALLLAWYFGEFLREFGDVF